jgi:hypothetical protein
MVNPVFVLFMKVQILMTNWLVRITAGPDYSHPDDDLLRYNCSHVVFLLAEDE